MIQEQQNRLGLLHVLAGEQVALELEPVRLEGERLEGARLQHPLDEVQFEVRLPPGEAVATKTLRNPYWSQPTASAWWRRGGAVPRSP